ncbi:hypothetical protein [Gloeomargarita lithophora]|nr:hypothetical protein [Gloeomargarita lithophora]
MRTPPWIGALLDRPYTPTASLMVDHWLTLVDGAQTPNLHQRKRRGRKK